MPPSLIDQQALISVSVRQAAALTSLAETTIRQAVYSGELSAVKVGNRIVIPHSDLVAWIESFPRVAQSA